MSGTYTYPLDLAWNVKHDNFRATRRDALIALIRANVPAAKKVYETLMPFAQHGARGIEYPCVMVRGAAKDCDLQTNAKYYLYAEYEIYVWTAGTQPGAVDDENGYIMETIEKLLSNDARGDITTAVPTYEYMRYENYWNESTFLRQDYSPPLLFHGEKQETLWAVVSKAIFKITWVALE